MKKVQYYSIFSHLSLFIIILFISASTIFLVLAPIPLPVSGAMMVDALDEAIDELDEMIEDGTIEGVNTDNTLVTDNKWTISIVNGASNLDNMAYKPNPLNITVGGVVTWTNNDSLSHRITQIDPTIGDISLDSFDSGFLGPDKSFIQYFDQPGEVKYSCMLHPTMTGRVFVVENNASN